MKKNLILIAETDDAYQFISRSINSEAKAKKKKIIELVKDNNNNLS